MILEVHDRYFQLDPGTRVMELFVVEFVERLGVKSVGCIAVGLGILEGRGGR
jgi:hypothetical protein